MKKSILYIIGLVILATSCSEYTRVSKSKDPDIRMSAARNYFQEKKYLKAASLFESCIPFYRGTTQSEELLFLLAESYFKSGDYFTASDYYESYAKSYPRGVFIKEVRFQIGNCYYLDSPDVRLDQTATVNAIDALNDYVELYPTSDNTEKAYEMMTNMLDKMAQKGFVQAKLYYNLGTYMGNNYQSAIIVAEQSLKDYPDSKFRDDLIFIILASKNKEAELSIQDKKAARYSEVIDEYYRYTNAFPEGKYIRQAKQFLKKAKQFVNQ